MDTRKCHYRYNTGSLIRKSRELISEERLPFKDKLLKSNSKVIKKAYHIKTGLGILLFFIFSSFLYTLYDVICEDLSDPVGENVTVIKCSECWNSKEKIDVKMTRKIPIKSQLANSELIWKRSVQQRREWIEKVGKGNLSNVNPWDGENGVYFWNYFPPSFNCPHSVERVGFIGDGGKWVCGLELYEKGKYAQGNVNNKPCIIYSFGVANESSFEAEMLNRTDCAVFAYDYSVRNIGFPVEASHPRVTFKALGIGNKNLGKFRTLKYLMEGNGHEWIDILKMDIEGGEYAALDKVMEDFQDLPFGQLLIEFHVEGKIFPRFFQFFERLESRNLRPFNFETNFVVAVSNAKPNYVEYSFVNVQGNHRLVN